MFEDDPDALSCVCVRRLSNQRPHTLDDIAQTRIPTHAQPTIEFTDRAGVVTGAHTVHGSAKHFFDDLAWNVHLSRTSKLTVVALDQRRGAKHPRFSVVAKLSEAL